jgi:DNA-binding MarR family transcriptional regulator
METSDPLAPILSDDAFDRNLNIRILRLATALQTILQRTTLRHKNVTTQEYRIFVSIARHGASHVRDLSRKAAIDPAHASRTMKAMEAKGWLERRPDPNDKRLAVFSMTDQGRALFLSIFPAADALAKDFAGLFDDEDALRFRDMLDTARDHAAKLLSD